MDQEDNFYTLKGYSLLEHVQITYSCLLYTSDAADE